MKAVVATFNQEKALVGALSVIVQPVVEPMEHYTTLLTIGGVMGETTDLGTVTTLGWGWLQGRWDVNPALRHSEEIRYITSELCDAITCVKLYYLGNVEDCFHNIEQRALG